MIPAHPEQLLPAARDAECCARSCPSLKCQYRALAGDLVRCEVLAFHTARGEPRRVYRDTGAASLAALFELDTTPHTQEESP